MLESSDLIDAGDGSVVVLVPVPGKRELAGIETISFSLVSEWQ